MKVKLYLVSFIILLICSPHLHSQNAMYFDGVDDYLQANIPPISGDFTIECWFNTNSVSSFDKGIFGISNGTSFLVLTVNNGELEFIAAPILLTPPLGSAYFETGELINPNQCYHLSVVRFGNDILLYLDCVLVSHEIGFFDAPFLLEQDLFIGGSATNPINESWDGLIDEFKIYQFAKSAQQIIDEKYCPVLDYTNLALYYNMETIDNGPGSIELSVDSSPNANDAQLFSYGLGDTKLINSCAPITFPDYSNIEIDIKNYYSQSTPLTEIYNGDPAHFSLSQNSSPISFESNVDLEWELSIDNGGSWVTLNNHPFANAYNFPVTSGQLVLDCNTSATGYVNHIYRVKFTVNDFSNNNTCIYYTNERSLKICCPVDNTNTSVVVNPPTALCEGQAANFQVDLISTAPYISTPGTNVNIDWFIQEGSNPYLSISLNNQTGFSYNYLAPVVGSTSQVCFRAEVSNCNKMKPYEECITIDAEPQCGTLIGSINPNNLIPVSSSPDPIYNICRFDDASIEMLLASDFTNCIAHWQYSFNGTVWLNEGSISNPQLNTNALPWDFNWNTSIDQIFYRIICKPLSNPSGCSPCESDVLQINIIDPPLTPLITGLDELCNLYFPTTISIQNVDPNYTYTWYHDNQVLGTGINWAAMDGGCYWVDAQNDCGITRSNIHCIERCETSAVISCPLISNECACLGQAIDLSGTDSSYSCDPTAILSYNWSWLDDTGVPMTSSATSINDIPHINGTSYYLTVTDNTTGCSSSSSILIIPCDK